MATYPTLPTTYDSFPTPIGKVAIDRAEDGTARGRSFVAADKVEFRIRHPLLSASDKSTLDTFYTTNRLLAFDYVSPIDSVSRSCLFTSKIKYELTIDGRWNATVQMEEA